MTEVTPSDRKCQTQVVYQCFSHFVHVLVKCTVSSCTCVVMKYDIIITKK